MSARAELLIVGRVATLAGDEGFGWQPALAIAEGRVLAAGPMSEMDALIGPQTEVWRLPPTLGVMPAITDAHLHLTMLARAREQVDLSAAHALDDWLRLLAEAHRRRLADGDDHGWLLGHGWSPADAGHWPDADQLEAAAPGRPIALWAHDHHSRWVSHAALRLAGIGAATPDPEGGVIRRHHDGTPTGILHEAAAGLVNRAIPPPSVESLERNLAATAADLAALGVTGCHDPGELDRDEGIGVAQHLYRRLAAEGRLPLRVHASIRDHHLAAAAEAGLRSGDGVASGHAPDARAVRLARRYRMGWLKLFADGSLGSRSAALLEPYEDAAQRPPTGGPRGMAVTGREELADLLERAARAGISGQVHAIGDAAVRTALDVLSDGPALPLRPRVEHAQLVDPADVARFGALGVAASIQPIHLRSDAAMARAAWGRRAEHAFPVAGALAGGGLVPFGTDAPVEPIDPWPGIAVAVHRRDPWSPSEAPLGMGHAVDLATAIRCACLHPALVAGEPDLGRLVAGQRADLLVVPAAALDEQSDARTLAEIRPLVTLLDGEVVYRDPGFDP